MSLEKLLKDPLAHFLAAAVVLFAFFSILKPPELEENIVVDREALLEFIQYRSRAFEPSAAAALLADMSDEERQSIIEDYIREEALYREAKKLGLAQGDYVIRQRMVQKLEFMTEAAVTPPPASAEVLQSYYEDHKNEYVIQPGATFTHVYISNEGKSRGQVETAAENLLGKLREENAGFEDAARFGDRFLYHTNYVERTYAYVHSHFGTEATNFIFSENTPLNRWEGPLRSEYGAHLVYVTARSPERIPSLSEIRDRIAEEYVKDVQSKQTDILIGAIIDEYSPEIRLDTSEPAE